MPNTGITGPQRNAAAMRKARLADVKADDGSMSDQDAIESQRAAIGDNGRSENRTYPQQTRSSPEVERQRNQWLHDHLAEQLSSIKARMGATKK